MKANTTYFLGLILLLLQCENFLRVFAATVASDADDAIAIDPQSAISHDCLASDKSSTILDFLKANAPQRRFRIQGWRWHTMSLIREAHLLSGAAAMEACDAQLLFKAAEYVIDFNMKGLHRVENEVFFPWIEQKLSGVGSNGVREAFLITFDQVKTDQKKACELGKSIMQQAALLSKIGNKASDVKANALAEIEQQALVLSSLCQSIFERADSLLVPVIAFLVPENEQLSFNNKVLRKLGVLNSRLHLVSMHEAVVERSKEELDLFNVEIPSVPRYLIPRWKRLLYDPVTSALMRR